MVWLCILSGIYKTKNKYNFTMSSHVSHSSSQKQLLQCAVKQKYSPNVAKADSTYTAARPNINTNDTLYHFSSVVYYE